ncbi:hypothetical protein [Saccharomonospora cyanea]|uniref:Uncharacterized protein n=1 Tax=Saccharomonospora cyanea NA-134 TaxID=882082 RepID=H5XEX2_9PSEU|nr:hypothetical protein [Saccharomonospora cyanea]EHR60366.1 hypothetical protein SaccyDRAFT_1462 [Saccharomonospora cyanea NA-134]
MPDEYGLDRDGIERLDDILHQVGNELGLPGFDQRATLEGFLTTQSVSRYENVEKPVEETALELTRSANEKYPRGVEAVQQFAHHAHVTIGNTAEGMAKAGTRHQVTGDDVAAWIRERGTGG